MRNTNYQRNLRPKTEINWNNLPVFLTVKQAAMIMNCSYSTIRNLCVEGKVPYVQLDNRLFRIERDGFRNMIERELERNEKD